MSFANVQRYKTIAEVRVRREQKFWIFFKPFVRISFIYHTLTLDRFRITTTATGKRQIQVDNFSKKEMNRYKLCKLTLNGWNWRETVELMNNKRHVTGKLGHFLGAPHENLHSWRRWGFFSLRCRHSKPFVYKWFGRCVGRLQRKLGVLEEEEIGVFLKLHPESPYCYDIKTSSSSNFFKCEKNAYLKKGKTGFFT